MYVEPADCVLKIEKIFGLENSSNREVFQKLLEEDLTRVKSGGQSAATVSESKEIVEIQKEKIESPRGREQRKKVKRSLTEDNSPLLGSSGNPQPAKQVTASEAGITKRRTRSETFKARNEGTSVIQLSNETENLNGGDSTISSRSTRRRRSNNALDEVSESKCVRRDSDSNKNVLIESSDVKEIKKLVTKIVREVAENARNEALKGEVKSKDMGAHITGGKTAEPSHGGKPNGPDEPGDDTLLGKMHDDDERTNDNAMPNAAAEQANDEIRGINGARRSEGCSKGMEEKCRSNLARRDEAMKPGETKAFQNHIHFQTECFLSPRCTRIMQSLGLSAPLGSPFCRNGSMP